MLFRLGLVGFDYPEWAGTFYPRPLPHKARLAHYAAHFNTVEINTTFYAIPTRKTITNWADIAAAASPGGMVAALGSHAKGPKHGSAEPEPCHPQTRLPFLFCPKLSREITHGPTPPGSLAASDSPVGHLSSPDTAATLRRWLASIRSLAPHLGPILIQFPPRFAASRTHELHDFLSTLPRDLRYAVEFRHRSWYAPDTTALLARHNIAWVAMDQTTRDQAEHAPPEPFADRLDDPTAHHPLIATTDFLYLRMLGRIGQFADRTREHFDPTSRLAWWADRLRAAAARHPHLTTAYVMFDNNLTGFAPATAARCARLLGLEYRHALPTPDANHVATETQGQLFAD